MTERPEIDQVTAEIVESIRASQAGQRRLMSKTFWDQYKIKRRSKELVEAVSESLADHDVIVTLKESTFGEENHKEWIYLTLQDPMPPEPDPGAPSGGLDAYTQETDWADKMAGQVYESEREVEYYFVIPLLHKLGYVDDDLAIGQRIEMYEGVRRIYKHADFVVYQGPGRALGDALLVVEAKLGEIKDSSVGQARAYAIWLGVPYYIVTNGQETRVFLFRGAVQRDVELLRFSRHEISSMWPQIHAKLSKESVVRYKSKLASVLPE